MSLRARFQAVAATAPRSYWIVWWGTLINRLGGFVVPLLTIYLTTERGVTVTDAGAAVSAFGAGQVLASFAGGQLADRAGRRVTMMLSLFSGAIVMTVLGTLHDLAAITLTVGLLGFAGELYRPAVSAFVSDVIPERDRLGAYGLLYWAVNLGWGFAAATGGLIAKYNFHILFYADAATMAAFGVLVAIAVPETKPARVVRAPDEASPAVSRPWWRDRVFATFVGINFLLVLIPMQSGAALSAHMTAQGFSPAAYGLVLGVNGMLIIVLQPYLVVRLARLDADRVLVASALIYSVGMIVHGFATLLVAHMAAVAIWTVAEMLESPTRSALVAAMAPADARGRYQGAFVMTWGAGALVGPLGTMVWERIGPHALWFGSAGLGVVVAVMLAATARDRRARVAATVVGGA